MKLTVVGQGAYLESIICVEVALDEHWYVVKVENLLLLLCKELFLILTHLYQEEVQLLNDLPILLLLELVLTPHYGIKGVEEHVSMGDILSTLIHESSQEIKALFDQFECHR